MARELQVLRFDGNGVRRALSADRLAGVALAERGEVWKPSRHPSQRSIVTWWWAATNRPMMGCRSMDRLRRRPSPVSPRKTRAEKPRVLARGFVLCALIRCSLRCWCPRSGRGGG